MEGEFCKFSDIPESIKGKVDVLLFNALKSAIPITWKLMLKEQKVHEAISTKWEQLEKLKHPTKTFYRQLIEEKNPKSELYYRWSKELKVELASTKHQLFVHIFSIANDVTLRTFHYRILNKILMTNNDRAKYNKKVSGKCSFCKEGTETIIHLFITCPQVKKLWKALKKWIKWKYELQVDFSETDIILNNFAGQKKYDRLFNMIILVLKRYIYVTGCKNEKLSFIQFLTYVKQMQEIKFSIASKNNKIKKHIQKWQYFHV